MMSQSLHRGVFSWPSSAWINRDKQKTAHCSQFSPGDLGLELTENSHEVEMERRVTKAMAEKTDESFPVFDMDKTVSKFYIWKKCFPRIRPFFAIKSHDDPCVISLLDHLGAGFDCASKMEVDLVVRQLNIKPENVIYANTVKAASHLAYAAKLGVDLMTFDNEEELYKIKKVFPMARLLLRLQPETSRNVMVNLAKKFGCPKENVCQLCDVAKALDLNLIGVSFHVGSGCNSSSNYIDMIRAAREVFKIAEDKGFRLHMLDIGGGFFGSDNAEEYLRELSGPINEALEEAFPLASGVTIISEPGRYFVASGLTVATCVIGKRVKDIPDVLSQYENGRHQKDPVFEYFISESTYGLFYDSLRPFVPFDPPLLYKASQDEERGMHESVIWGDTCDSADKIISAWSLPEMHIGDWLVFHNRGAYSVSRTTCFNGFQVQPIQRTINKDMWNSIFQEGSIIMGEGE